MGGRLFDTIQAAVLNVKLKYYEKDLKQRQRCLASKYTKALNAKNIETPFVKSDRTSAWAQYSIRVQNRTELQNKTSKPRNSNSSTLPNASTCTRML